MSCFGDFEKFVCISIYCVSALSLHIESTDSMTNLLCLDFLSTQAGQELMSGEAAKERVTPVPSKYKFLMYFCFGSAQCVSCCLSPTFGVEANAAHFKAFPAREVLWHCICSSALYPEFLKQLIVGYTDLYKAHHRGRDKYAHFLVA